jgi:hypothetical protein
MPIVLNDPTTNLFVYIFTNDHDPAHVHVFKGRKRSSRKGYIKINIGTVSSPPALVIVTDEDVKSKDIVNALNLVAENQEYLLGRWSEYHGNK